MATNKKRYRRPSVRERKPELTWRERVTKTAASLKDGASSLTRAQKGVAIGGAVAVLALVVLIFFLLAPRPLQFTKDADGNLVDEKHGITYYLAPVNFEPEAWKKDVYAVCGDLELHRISDLNPERWICEVNEGVGSVWYASTITLPDLGGFKASEIAVCTQTETVMALKLIEDDDHVKAVVDAFENGEAVEIVPQASRYLRLKFTSQAYPRLLYDISYLECADGNYLYDRESQKCVPIGTMLLWYINRADMEFDENTLIPSEDETNESDSESVEATGVGESDLDSGVES